MAPASASLLPSAGAKRPAAAVSDAEAPLLQQVALYFTDACGDQDGGAAAKNQSSQQQQLECPRCKSSNTKFCYYNNYSTTQPRHFCRACHRYWTHGGTLRNVPIGGACRRGAGGNKRRRSSQPSPSSGSPAENAAFPPDQLPAMPFFPFLSDGAVFLPQFDLGLGGCAAAPTGFSWPAAAGPDLDGLTTPWDVNSGTLPGGAWEDFTTGLELT